MLDDYTRAQVTRAIEDALHPRGMSIHSGKTSVDAALLQRLVAMIDRGAAASLEALDRIAELERAISDALPGVAYMDPPDGGSVSLAGQLRRLAADAARYRWLRNEAWGARGPVPVVFVTDELSNPQTDPASVPAHEYLDAAIDDAMRKEGE
jgi:hypothetical protein